MIASRSVGAYAIPHNKPRDIKIKGDTSSAGIEDLIPVVDASPPQDIELLEREVLPTPSDDTPLFSPDYADRQRHWSEALQSWAKRELAP